MDEIRITIRLSPDLHRRLKAVATADKRSLNAELQVLLEEAFRTRDKQQKETSPSPPA